MPSSPPRRRSGIDASELPGGFQARGSDTPVRPTGKPCFPRKSEMSGEVPHGRAPESHGARTTVRRNDDDYSASSAGLGRDRGPARPEALDRARDPVEHAVHHRARQHDPERRRPDDHPRVPHPGVVAAVGDLGLLAGVRVAADQLRSPRRHRRPPQDVLHRRGAVRGRLADRVAVALGRAAVHRRVADRGHRRGDDAAGHAVDPLGDVPGPRARRGVRGVGIGRRRRGRARSVDRRHPHHRLLVAVGVPRQRRDRAARDPRRASSTCTSRRTSARRASTRPASSRSPLGLLALVFGIIEAAPLRLVEADRRPVDRRLELAARTRSRSCPVSLAIAVVVLGVRSCGSRLRRVAAGQAGRVRLHRPRAPRASATGSSTRRCSRWASSARSSCCRSSCRPACTSPRSAAARGCCPRASWRSSAAASAASSAAGSGRST